MSGTTKSHKTMVRERRLATLPGNTPNYNPTCSGSALFFSISGGRGGSLKCHRVTDTRVRPIDRHTKLEKFTNSGPLFLECRNFFKVPPTSKGLTIAFKLKAGPDSGKWRLGIINKLDTNQLSMEIFVWSGLLFKRFKGTHQHSTPYTIYPAYYFLSYAALTTPTMAGKFQWLVHFQQRTIKLDWFSDFRYINQVDGLMPKCWVFTRCALLNPWDGGYEQSMLGPDIAMLPPSQQIEACPFPVLDVPVSKLIIPFATGEDRSPFQSMKRQRFHKRNTKKQTRHFPPYLLGSRKGTVQEQSVPLVLVCDHPLRNVIPEKHKTTFYVPFPSDRFNTRQRFAIIDKAMYSRVLDILNNVPIETFELLLHEIAVEVVQYPSFHEATKGLAFMLVDEDAFDEVVAKESSVTEFLPPESSLHHPVRIAAAGKLTGAPHLSDKFKGVVLSIWLKDMSNHPGRITLNFVNMILKCIGKGFGSRYKVSANGLNHYDGLRLSYQSRPSPVEGKNRARSSTYHRKHFHHFQYFTVLSKKWSWLKDRMETYALKMDHHFSQFISPVKEGTRCDVPQVFKKSPCQIAIVTSGTSAEISFSNECHLDGGDVYSKAESESMLKELEKEVHEIPDTEKELKKNGKRFLDYVQMMNNTVGIGIPTSCSYQHVTDRDDFDFVQFFVMEGLGSAVQIEDYSSHTFYGHAFVHNTSLCLAVDRFDKVWVRNSDSAFCRNPIESNQFGTLFGWGAGGKGSTRRTRRSGSNARSGTRSGTGGSGMGGSGGNVCDEVQQQPIPPRPPPRNEDLTPPHTPTPPTTPTPPPQESRTPTPQPQQPRTPTPPPQGPDVDTYLNQLAEQFSLLKEAEFGEEGVGESDAANSLFKTKLRELDMATEKPLADALIKFCWEKGGVAAFEFVENQDADPEEIAHEHTIYHENLQIPDNQAEIVNVRGDGNCGYHSLVLGLFDTDNPTRTEVIAQNSSLEMRRRMREYAENPENQSQLLRLPQIRDAFTIDESFDPDSTDGRSRIEAAFNSAREGIATEYAAAQNDRQEWEAQEHAEDEEYEPPEYLDPVMRYDPITAFAHTVLNMCPDGIDVSRGADAAQEMHVVLGSAVAAGLTHSRVATYYNPAINPESSPEEIAQHRCERFVFDGRDGNLQSRKDEAVTGLIENADRDTINLVWYDRHFQYLKPKRRK